MSKQQAAQRYSGRESSSTKGAPDVLAIPDYFLGIPILWPDMRPFGTIHISDCKENLYSDEHRKLIGQFRSQIEAHLELIDLRQRVAAGEALRKAKEKAEKDD